jgi:hypothetical protein
MPDSISSTHELQLIRSAEKIVAPLIREGVFEDFERALKALLSDYVEKQIAKYQLINSEFEIRHKQKFDAYTNSLKNNANFEQEDEWMDWESAIVLLSKWKKIQQQVKNNGSSG